MLIFSVFNRRAVTPANQASPPHVIAPLDNLVGTTGPDMSNVDVRSARHAVLSPPPPPKGIDVL